MSLKRIIEKTDTTAGKVFDFFIQFLIIVSVLSFLIETLSDLSGNARQILRVSEIITIAIFTIEYFLRILVADRKLKFIFSFFGLIDLLAILPFYVASGIDLRSIRIIRLLRFFRPFRALKLFRYN